LKPRRLPGAHLAIIEERKLTQYLLASGHPAGGAKAAFFEGFGFSAAQWQTLRDALHAHLRSARIVAVSETEFGRKYTLEGSLTAPDGRKPQVRAIWFVATGEVAPRLVRPTLCPE
jgi:filamentous hemagglutinin